MTGIFIGDTAPSKIFIGGQQVSKVFAGDAQVRPITPPGPLPSTYQQVEYIKQITGTSGYQSDVSYLPRIDTLYIPQVDYFRIDLDFTGRRLSGWSNYSGSRRYSAGSYTDASTFRIYNGNTTSPLEYRRSVPDGDLNCSLVVSGNSSGGTMYLYDVTTGNLLTSKAYSGNIQANGSTLTYPLFVRRESSTNEFQADSYLRSCKIYSAGDVLERNFIPCYRKSDGRTGLYDTVNGVFHDNQCNRYDASTGKLYEFELGPDV